MNNRVAKATLEVIRTEQARLQSRLPDDPGAAYDQYLYFDKPFINDLCLMLLVAIHHQVERELVLLAAKVVRDDELTLSADEYRRRVKEERRLFANRGSREQLTGKLRLPTFHEWNTSLESLRLLVNIYKHAPFGGPEGRSTQDERDNLRKHLNLDRKHNYASLPDSGGVREGLTFYSICRTMPIIAPSPRNFSSEPTSS